MDTHCKRIGIGCTKEDPRSRYYTSPYHDLWEKGFVNKENIGPRLTIDEVNLWNQVYTILANPEKNKIVALIPWVKSSIVTEAIRKEISFEERLKVREVTLDMSPTMDFIVGELFPQTKRTLDRFHVTKNVLEDIQSIRMRSKTLIKDEELQKEEQCKIARMRYIPRKLENSETRLDFITRLRYQLFERRKDWGEYQIKRWEVLKIHSEFDEIRISYELLEKFYEIYDSKVSWEQARSLWQDWFQRISKHEAIKELQNAGRTVKNHLEGILNYFGTRSTNAFAEWLHSRIRRMISSVRWFKNKHYMLYRIMKIFA